jgi:hypothetical protein
MKNGKSKKNLMKMLMLELTRTPVAVTQSKSRLSLLSQRKLKLNPKNPQGPHNLSKSYKHQFLKRRLSMATSGPTDSGLANGRKLCY